jgi:hypothetical protein
MSSSSLSVSRVLLYLARLRLPHFQRLILLFEIPELRSACRRSSTQAAIFYAFGAGPSGRMTAATHMQAAYQLCPGVGRSREPAAHRTGMKRAPGASTPGAREFIQNVQRLLLGQPLIPVLRKLVDIIFGDGNQFSLHKGGRRIFVIRDLVVQHVD